jgi:hypothetical protein
MIRPAEDARVLFHPTLSDVGWMILQVADDEVAVRELSETEFRRFLRSAAQAPQQVTTAFGSALWMFHEEYFWADPGLTQDEVQQEIGVSQPSG